jgi:hypothetical protein
MEQPQEVFQQTENISLHYPFPRSSHTVVGSWDTALARIKQTRSGKPHVTGTLPLNVKPDEGEEIPEEANISIPAPVTPAVPQVLSEPIPKAVAETQELDEDKEQEKKRRRKERRLVRKAKKAQAEAAAPRPTTSPGKLSEPETEAEDFENEGVDPEDDE